MFAQELRNLAIELHIPILALAQLNRDSDGAKPKMSHLKGSGDIEQEASQIILLDRPEAEPHIASSREYRDAHGHSVKMTDPSRVTGNTAAIIAKSRHSSTAVALMTFEGEYGRFNEYSPAYPGRVDDASVPEFH
jgi:replicative DNA helicase